MNVLMVIALLVLAGWLVAHIVFPKEKHRDR